MKHFIVIKSKRELVEDRNESIERAREIREAKALAKEQLRKEK